MNWSGAGGVMLLLTCPAVASKGWRSVGHFKCCVQRVLRDSHPTECSRLSEGGTLISDSKLSTRLRGWAGWLTLGLGDGALDGDQDQQPFWLRSECVLTLRCCEDICLRLFNPARRRRRSLVRSEGPGDVTVKTSVLLWLLPNCHQLSSN